MITPLAQPTPSQMERVISDLTMTANHAEIAEQLEDELSLRGLVIVKTEWIKDILAHFQRVNSDTSVAMTKIKEVLE